MLACVILIAWSMNVYYNVVDRKIGRGAVMEIRTVRPTERGQVTIPKEIREQLGITPKTNLRVYTESGKIVLEPQSPLDVLLKELQQEASEKGYTREELDNEITLVRKKLMQELYGNSPHNA